MQRGCSEDAARPPRESPRGPIPHPFSGLIIRILLGSPQGPRRGSSHNPCECPTTVHSASSCGPCSRLCPTHSVRLSGAPPSWETIVLPRSCTGRVSTAPWARQLMPWRSWVHQRGGTHLASTLHVHQLGAQSPRWTADRTANNSSPAIGEHGKIELDRLRRGCYGDGIGM